MKKIIGIITILCAITVSGFAQQKTRGKSLDSLDTKYLNWQNLDPQKDSVMGVSTERAYKELLQNKKPKKEIIVAVIDAGVDVNHEDLQGKIWVNADEIPGNGIDDDHNGYVDDINGWNFLGNAKGENVLYANEERTRVIRKYHERYKNVKSADELSEQEAKKYKIYKRCLDLHNENYDRITAWKANMRAAKKQFVESKKVLAQYLTKNPICKKELGGITPKNEAERTAKEFLLKEYENGFKSVARYDELLQKYYQNTLKYYSNLEFKERQITGDNGDNLSDMYYGNNKVLADGYASGHGTFVAGLIAAKRHNGIGIDGIAENVKIMAIRAVPNGDENDKDVALAIKYAIDNGADIINMSFGKYYSANRPMVDSILRYAKNKNVLLFTSAGNAALDNDEVEKYPCIENADGTKILENWITVGASSMDNKNKRLPGYFSNYGKRTVEFFAPGVGIISTYPQSTYRKGNGTSYASPIAAGVAALVWSYYPELTALQLKNVLLKSVEKSTDEVFIPKKGKGEKKKTSFKELSVTGGIVNAYKALKRAEKVVILKNTIIKIS